MSDISDNTPPDARYVIEVWNDVDGAPEIHVTAPGVPDRDGILHLSERVERELLAFVRTLAILDGVVLWTRAIPSDEALAGEL